jgi:hypothetical protein
MAIEIEKTAEQESSRTIVFENDVYRVFSLRDKLPRADSSKAFASECGSECTSGYVTVPCAC